jgi:hypothetical protein
LANDQEFGGGSGDDSTVLGYETDAAAIEDGTSQNFIVLARADLSDWPGSTPAPAGLSPEDR